MTTPALNGFAGQGPVQASDRAAARIDAGGRHPAMSQQAFDWLRQAILSQDIPAGAKLRIDALRRESSFSSSPLREALSKLTMEGLVILDDHRGFRVAPLSAVDLADITALRLIVELEMLTRSMARGSDAWESAIVSTFHQLERTEQRTRADPLRFSPEWTARHKAFHLALVGGSESPRMMAVCASLFDQAERYRRLSATQPRKERDPHDEHRQIMAAVLDRRVDDAARLLSDHIVKTSENVTTILFSEREG